MLKLYEPQYLIPIFVTKGYKQKNPRGREINLIPRGNTPVGAEGFEPPTLCL